MVGLIAIHERYAALLPQLDERIIQALRTMHLGDRLGRIQYDGPAAAPMGAKGKRKM
jgi:hypothetical protein